MVIIIPIIWLKNRYEIRKTANHQIFSYRNGFAIFFVSLKQGIYKIGFVYWIENNAIGFIYKV